MAFKATAIVTENAFQEIRRRAATLKSFLQVERGLMVQLNVDSQVPLAVLQYLGDVIPRFNTLAATPGLAGYAQDQVNDPAYDIAAEFTVMRNACQAALDNLVAMFPKDGNGFLLYQTMNASGVISTRTFTAAQVAAAVALIDSVIATID